MMLYNNYLLLLGLFIGDFKLKLLKTVVSYN